MQAAASIPVKPSCRPDWVQETPALHRPSRLIELPKGSINDWRIQSSVSEQEKCILREGLIDTVVDDYIISLLELQNKQRKAFFFLLLNWSDLQMVLI